MYRVIASGSLLGIRMKEIRFNPMRYLKRVEMHSMNFEEFFWTMGIPRRSWAQSAAASHP